MARVTIDECLSKISNRFDLVVLAARRARDISAGDSVRVQRSNDKSSIIALREIEGGLLTEDELKESLIQKIATEHSFESEEPEACLSSSEKFLEKSANEEYELTPETH